MKKNETGRSMVEMLGVLAIIGVLSVGGIAGYTMAMNKYRANEILNTASMMVMLTKSADAGAGKALASLSDAGLEPPYKDITMETAIGANGLITVTVGGATYDVCHAVSAAAPAEITKEDGTKDYNLFKIVCPTTDDG